MKAGARFWQLIGMVMLILGAYGLIEQYDTVKIKKNQLDTQKQILLKQKTVLNDSHWVEDLAAVDSVRTAWLAYLPTADSVAVAKAQLLNDMRSLAQNAGVTNLLVTATEVEKEKNSLASGYNSNFGSTAYLSSDRNPAEIDTLPEGVLLIKVKLGGRFEPAAFTALLQELENGRFAVVERISIRGVQMELSLRHYWQRNLSIAGNVSEKAAESQNAVTR